MNSPDSAGNNDTNKTEDDTFKALCKPSYRDMQNLYNDWLDTISPTSHRFFTERSDMFATHNWSIDDYLECRHYHLAKIYG